MAEIMRIEERACRRCGRLGSGYGESFMVYPDSKPVQIYACNCVNEPDLPKPKPSVAANIIGWSCLALILAVILFTLLRSTLTLSLAYPHPAAKVHRRPRERGRPGWPSRSTMSAGRFAADGAGFWQRVSHEDPGRRLPLSPRKLTHERRPVRGAPEAMSSRILARRSSVISADPHRVVPCQRTSFPRSPPARCQDQTRSALWSTTSTRSVLSRQIA